MHVELGRIVATPGALQTLADFNVSPIAILERYIQCDWGDLDLYDKQMNDQALHIGERLLASYSLNQDTRLWIITEADRSITTLLLPEEY